MLNDVFACVPMLLVCAAALASPARLSTVEEAAAFGAAGYTLKGKQWRLCDDPGTLSYAPGSIQVAGDLNGDGHPEAVISEASVYCYGNTSFAYGLVSKQADGSWKFITSGTGVLSFLTTTGVGGWPDIEIGGPGFCFPVLRWNGSDYVLLRHQYEGAPCGCN